VEDQPYVRDQRVRAQTDVRRTLTEHDFATTTAQGRDLDLVAASELALSIVTPAKPAREIVRFGAERRTTWD
jgi:hypothetical protein